jgi:mono/diheme cytochrome c family protein
MSGRMKDESLDDAGGNSLKPILLIMATLMAFFACASHARADDVAWQARHLLAQRCFVCHGPDRNSEDAKETDLRLDLREVALEYDALVPGDAAASELMTRVTSRDSDSQMPPPGHGKPLSKDEIEVLRRWIAAGAIYESHWSFRKLQETQVPERPGRRSTGNPIDAFVLKRLGEKGIQPSPKADKRTLIRRVYADAIGMPPSPEEFQRFVDDPAPDAYEQLVDRALKNRHFGERWAPHWLDVARFAESGGFELDGIRPHAYQFRDFVIKAFNDDLPYNHFVQWQIAGDEFAPDNIEALKATGFLGCGVRNAVITKNQVEKERYDELDDILSTTMTSMLGLSVGCARCHDHKYDPITSNDYYRLLSTFTTTVRAEITVTQPSAEMDKALGVFEREHKRLVARLADYEKESRNSKSYTNPTIQHQPLLLSPWQSTGPLKTTGYVAGHNTAFPPEKTPGSKPAPSATWRRRPELVDGTSHRISESNSVFFFHRTITAESATPTVLSFGADDTLKAWLDGELIAERIVAAAVNPDQALAHVTLPKGEHHLLVKIVNGPGIGGFYFNVKQQGVPGTVRDIVTTPVAQRSPQQADTLLNWSRQFDAKWKQLSTEVTNHLAQKPKLSQKTVFVSTEGRKGFRPAIYNVQGPEFYERTYILDRGNPNSKREPATQSFLQILMQHADKESHWIEQPTAESKSSYRRRSFANWITDTQHGAGSLLARVIVNRLWQHHFGKGLVTTPNDFGTQGTLPTHPELLEWLACELVRNDWSLKHIHRLIMTSETFQQESAFSENAAKGDPENKLLWRFTPRRLEAEAIRDSILAVSGQLDRTMFGTGTLDPRQKRRSIYFTVKRSLLNPMLNLYDAPETLTSAGRRTSTTTAPQALLLINSPYIRELAQAFAVRISPQPNDDLSTIVSKAYQLALNRNPSNNDMQAAMQFIERQQNDYEQSNTANAKSAALADFAQALFSINEFIYVD